MRISRIKETIKFTGCHVGRLSEKDSPCYTGHMIGRARGLHRLEYLEKMLAELPG